MVERASSPAAQRTRREEATAQYRDTSRESEQQDGQGLLTTQNCTGRDTVIHHTRAVRRVTCYRFHTRRHMHVKGRETKVGRTGPGAGHSPNLCLPLPLPLPRHIWDRGRGGDRRCVVPNFRHQASVEISLVHVKLTCSAHLHPDLVQASSHPHQRQTKADAPPPRSVPSHPSLSTCSPNSNFPAPTPITSRLPTPHVGRGSSFVVRDDRTSRTLSHSPSTPPQAAWNDGS